MIDMETHQNIHQYGDCCTLMQIMHAWKTECLQILDENRTTHIYFKATDIHAA